MNIITNIQGHGELTFLCAIWRVSRTEHTAGQSSRQLLFSQGRVRRARLSLPVLTGRTAADNEMKKSQFIKSSILTDSLAVRCADFTPSGK